MRIRLYTIYKDGRKVCYKGKMKQPPSESSCVFDYYVKFRTDMKIEKMIAEVIDEGNNDKIICRTEVYGFWRSPLSEFARAKYTYFGITICGKRIVSDTVVTLNGHSNVNNCLYKVVFMKDGNGEQIYDRKGNPLSRTIRTSIHSHSVKTVTEDGLNRNIQRIINNMSV